VKKTAEEQRAEALERSGFNKKIQESQKRLGEFSNGFQIALANSGMLDFLMKAFSVMATLVQTIVVPAFNFIAFAITAVFAPIEALAAFIEDNTVPVLLGLGTALTAYTGLLIIKNFATIAETAATVAKTIALLAVIGPLGLFAIGLAAVTSPLGIFVIAVAGLVYIFKKLYDSGWGFGSVLEAMGDNLKRFGLAYTDIWLSIAEKIAGFFGKGDAIKAARARIADEQKELDEREKARDGKRKLVADEREAAKEKNRNARKSNAEDAKNLDEKKKLAAENVKIDYNSGPEALLKQVATKEGSPLVPKDKQEATKKAEGTKKEIEAKGEAKSAAEEKAATEKSKAEEKAKEENKKDTKSKPATQESAETLLASLNTKMDQLIKINKGTHEVNEQQLSVQKGLSGDLFAA
jgi:hypothetical protein